MSRIRVSSSGVVPRYESPDAPSPHGKILQRCRWNLVTNCNNRIQEHIWFAKLCTGPALGLSRLMLLFSLSYLTGNPEVVSGFMKAGYPTSGYFLGL